jgi:hypothetical protein
VWIKFGVAIIFPQKVNNCYHCFKDQIASIGTQTITDAVNNTTSHQFLSLRV